MASASLFVASTKRSRREVVSSGLADAGRAINNILAVSHAISIEQTTETPTLG